MSKKKKDPYKYSYEQLQEKYKDCEWFDDLQDAQLAIHQLVELLRLGMYEIKKVKENEQIK